jgi:hypothetical protein
MSLSNPRQVASVNVAVADQERVPERLLTPEILTLAAVVVLGAIMTTLDATIVSVALPTLGRDFRSSRSTFRSCAVAALSRPGFCLFRRDWAPPLPCPSPVLLRIKSVPGESFLSE